VDAVAVEVQLLLIDRNENLLRPFRNIADRFFAPTIGGFRFVRFMRGFMFVQTAVPAAIPVGGRCWRGTRRQGHGNGKRESASADDTAIPPRRRRLVVSCARDEQFSPRQREIVSSPAANSSGPDQLSPSRECDAAVANCGKTSVVTTQWNAEETPQIINGPWTSCCISGSVCLPCSIAHAFSGRRLKSAWQGKCFRQKLIGMAARGMIVDHGRNH